MEAWPRLLGPATALPPLRCSLRALRHREGTVLSLNCGSSNALAELEDSKAVSRLARRQLEAVCFAKDDYPGEDTVAMEWLPGPCAAKRALPRELRVSPRGTLSYVLETTWRNGLQFNQWADGLRRRQTLNPHYADVPLRCELQKRPNPSVQCETTHAEIPQKLEIEELGKALPVHAVKLAAELQRKLCQ
jgi:hypothetical protein